MKKLIIVCEEKYRVYGDYLAQLISLEDDTDDNTIGIKDGEVAAQVWTEKDYNSNAAQISSAQYIVFIGNKKLIREKSSHMQVKFSEFGMTYGWLGKQAALTVNKSISANEYDDFLSYALQYQNDLKQLITIKEKKTKQGKDEKSEGKIALINALPVAIAPVAGVFKSITLNKKIEAQQFSCAVMKFYLDALGEFLGM